MRTAMFTVAFLTTTLHACSAEELASGSEREHALLAELSPLPDAPPPDSTNRYADDTAAADFGQMLSNG